MTQKTNISIHYYQVYRNQTFVCKKIWSMRRYVSAMFTYSLVSQQIGERKSAAAIKNKDFFSVH